MSHITKFAMVFTERDLLLQALDEFNVEVDRDTRLEATRGGQVFDSEAVRDATMDYVVTVPGGEQIGFQMKSLSDSERSGMVDSTETRSSVARKGLVPVGDMYYGGLTRTLGQGLCKLQAKYYEKLMRRKLGRQVRVTTKDVGDEVILEVEV